MREGLIWADGPGGTLKEPVTVMGKSPVVDVHGGETITIITN
jgi:hypothetical protein